MHKDNARKAAVRNLIEHIKSKDIVTGDKLVPERELEKKLAISRSVV